MHALKWWNLNTRMWFAGEDGGGSEAPASAPAGGDGGGGAPGGATAAPSPSPSGAGEAPAPVAPAAPVAAPQASEASFDWSALGSTDDLDYMEIPAVAPAPPKELAPTPQPPTPAQPEPTQPVEPQAPATTAQPQPEAASRPLSAADPWRIAEGLEANRDAVIAHLATSKFALSEAEISELDTDVNAAIPKIMSRVFLESQVSMQKFLAQAVPGMVRQFNTVTSANSDAEKRFFEMHKALDVNNPQHRSTAVRIATVYRQANPNIPLNQLIAEVGPMVMTTLRMNAPVQQNAPPVARAAAAAAGFRPAVNGGGGISPTPDPGSPWEGLGRNYDE